MTSALRTAGNWAFRDRATGRIVIAQRPNVPLVLWLGCETTNRVVQSFGGRSTALPAAGRVALAIWAVDEIVRGVNPWRRLLGVGVTGAAVSVWATSR